MKSFLETIKIKDGHFVNLSSHLRRIQATASTFFTTCPVLTIKDEDIPQHLRSGIVKCRIVYDIAIREITFTPYVFRPVCSLRVITDNTIDYRFKYENRSSLNILLSQKGECDDILIVRNGMITDTSFTNLIFSRSGHLYTPSSYLLNGTKRQLLLAQGVICEQDIQLCNLSLYDRVFLINAMIDPEDNISLPVTAIQI